MSPVGAVGGVASDDIKSRAMRTSRPISQKKPERSSVLHQFALPCFWVRGEAWALPPSYIGSFVQSGAAFFFGGPTLRFDSTEFFAAISSRACDRINVSRVSDRGDVRIPGLVEFRSMDPRNSPDVFLFEEQIWHAEEKSPLGSSAGRSKSCSSLSCRSTRGTR